MGMREETLEGKEVAGGAEVIILKSRFVTTEGGLAVIPFMSGTWSRCGWIVWVCISQTDLEEKAQQVQMIGQIFKQAVGVLAWIGEGSEGKGNNPPCGKE